MKKILSSIFIAILFLLTVFHTFLFAEKATSIGETDQPEEKKVSKRLYKIISVDLKNIPLEKALSIIADKGKFKLNYNRSRIPVYQKVSVKMDNVPTIKALKKILDDTGTELKITTEGQFAIIPKKDISHTKPKLPRGMIKGQVLDDEIKAPLAGVKIFIANSQINTTTDQNGNFVFPNIPVGNYTVVFSYPEYEMLSKTDIIVRSKRITFIQSELKLAPFKGDDIVVTAGYFSQTEGQPTSAVNFSSEEIRRAPGAAGDISRLLKVLPGTTNLNDQTNDLIVRGGNPSEDAFFIDNIGIPNINHFPVMFSSGGKVSAANPDLIQDVNFYTGGFSSAYGDRLSSIIDIAFREGNKDEFDGQVDLSFAGIGGILEGPIAGGKGSWLISGRQSFIEVLDFLGIIDLGAVPSFSDVQGKLTFNINPKNKISFLNFFGNGKYDYKETYFFNDNQYTQNTFGVNWLYLWSEKGFSKTSLSSAYLKNKDIYGYQYLQEEWRYGFDFWEKSYSLRNTNHFILNSRNKIEFGIQVKHKTGNYNYYVDQYTDYFGNVKNADTIRNDSSGTKTGAFFSYIWNPFKRLTTIFGCRGDYFSFNKHFHLSPRLSLSFKINDNFFLNGSVGIYYQTFPLSLLSLNPEFKNLKDMKSTHYILGLEYLTGSGTKISLEAYDKEYRNLPIDPEYPDHLRLDRRENELHYFPKNLTNCGIAYSRGIELLIQKKLVKRFYGILSASYFKCRYRDYFGVWRNRLYDNRYMFGLTGGYKPNRNWEFSVHCTLLGGAPYTPVDMEKSKAQNEYILDWTRINEAYYPYYFSLNLRVDRRFYFSGAGLILYIDIWNFTNKKNIYSYYWNKNYNELGTYHQFGIIPVFGVEFEF